MKVIALAGNPNSGKTTLFNTLTGSTAHVGNWPGVTVDKKVGTYKKGSEHLLLIFPIVGTLFSVIGFVLLINKKVQNYLLKLPVSESI